MSLTWPPACPAGCASTSPPLRALLVLTVLLGLAYPLVVAGIAQIPGLKSTGGRLDRHRRRPRRRPSPDRPGVHRRRGRPAPAVLPVPALGGRRRVRPDRDLGVATSARRASSTRPRRPGDQRGRQQAEPADPGLRAQPGDRQAGGRRRRPAVLHARRRRRGAGRLPRRSRLRGRGDPRGQRQRVLRPTHRRSSPRTRACAVECHQSGEDVAAVRWCRSAGTHRRTRPCRPTRSPPAAAGSTRTSARRTRTCRRRGWRRSATSGRPGAAAGRDHTAGACSGFLGEPGVNVLELNMALDRAAR